MCFPKAPRPRPLPQTPQRDDDAILQRERRELEQLTAFGGTAGTRRSDLSPSALAGPRKVLLGV
jgi:hypothetical protein